MEAVIFIGIQGTGKSSFYLEQFFHTHVRINSDNYIELSGDMLVKDAISPVRFSLRPHQWTHRSYNRRS
jgi:hypothetical protein